jgi:hypothetical protein
MKEPFRTSLVGRGVPPRRFIAVCLAMVATFLTLACSITTPRVLEVTSRTRLKDIDPVDEDLFADDRASRIQYEPRDLGIDAQREEFYVRWAAPPTSRSGPASVDRVKFEYRQVAKPNTIFEQDYVPHGESSKLFAVRGEDFRSGGSVSAWRVSLWDNDQLVAEKKSFLW